MSKSATTLAKVRSNIESLVQRHAPLGISYLPYKYKTEYNQPLDYTSLGYWKLSDFIKDIPSIKLRKNKGTDPTLSLIKAEQSPKNSNNKANFAIIQSNVEFLVQRREPVTISLLLEKYQAEYNQPLDFKAMGYGTLTKFLEAIPSIQLTQFKGRDLKLTYMKTKHPSPKEVEVEAKKDASGNPGLAVVQENILQLVRKKGPMSSLAFRTLYQEEYKQMLDFNKFGYGKLSQLLTSVPTVVLKPLANRDSYTIMLDDHKGTGHSQMATASESEASCNKKKRYVNFREFLVKMLNTTRGDNPSKISGIEERISKKVSSHEVNHQLPSESFFHRVQGISQQIQDLAEQKISVQTIEKASLVRQADVSIHESKAVFTHPYNDAEPEQEMANENPDISLDIIQRRSEDELLRTSTTNTGNKNNTDSSQRMKPFKSLKDLLRAKVRQIQDQAEQTCLDFLNKVKGIFKLQPKKDKISESYSNQDGQVETDNIYREAAAEASDSRMDRLKDKCQQSQDQAELSFPLQRIEKACLVRQSDALLLKNAALFAHTFNVDDSERGKAYLNTDEPFCLATIGVQGAGKSHTLACILESCLIPMAEIVRLQKPMTTLVLHYDENTLSVCEAAGLLKPSPSSSHESHLLQPKAIILVSPTYYKQRKEFYGENCSVRPLLFKWESLTADRIKRIMHIGPDDNQLYFATLMNLLRRYQKQVAVPSFQRFLEDVKDACSCLGQRGPLEQRIKLLETVVAESDENRDIAEESLDLAAALSSGYNFIIADLTDPLLSREDINGLFGVMVEQFRTTPSQGGKVLALDEAHKYMNGTRSDNLSKEVVKVARLMRHEGIRLVVSTQSPKSLAPELLEQVSLAVLHHFHSHDWLYYLKQKIPLPDNIFQAILSLKPGEAIAFSSKTTFSEQVMQVRVRSRLTADFGESRKNN